MCDQAPRHLHGRVLSVQGSNFTTLLNLLAVEPLTEPSRMVEVPQEVTSLTASLGDQARDLRTNFYSYYNQGVIRALEGVRALPDTTGRYADQV